MREATRRFKHHDSVTRITPLIGGLSSDVLACPRMASNDVRTPISSDLRRVDPAPRPVQGGRITPPPIDPGSAARAPLGAVEYAPKGDPVMVCPSPPPPSVQWYKIVDVARMTQVHPDTVRKWIDEGDLDVVHIGNTVRVTQAALDDLAYRRRRQALDNQRRPGRPRKAAS